MAFGASTCKRTRLRERKYLLCLSMTLTSKFLEPYNSMFPPFRQSSCPFPASFQGQSQRASKRVCPPQSLRARSPAWYLCGQCLDYEENGHLRPVKDKNLWLDPWSIWILWLLYNRKNLLCIALALNRDFFGLRKNHQDEQGSGAMPFSKS